MKKLAAAVIFTFFIQLVTIALPSPAQSASFTYRYQGYTYTRVSVTIFVTISFTSKSKSRASACRETQPRNVIAQPGPIGSKSVLVRWSAPACGKPSEGYQVGLTDIGNFDAETAVKADGSASYGLPSTKYLKVDPSKTAVMIEGFDLAQSIKIVVGAVGYGGLSESAEVITKTSSADSSSVSPSPISSIGEESNINGDPKATGIRVKWERSAGNVKYYVVQYSLTPNPNCSGVYCEFYNEEKYVPPDRTDAIISQYKSGKYRVRIKSVGENGSISFSPYAFVTASSDNSNMSRDLYGSSSQFVRPGLIPKISYISTDSLQNSHILKMSNYDPGFIYSFANIIPAKAAIDSSGTITLSNLEGCYPRKFLLLVKREGYTTTTNNLEFEPKCRALPAPTFGPVMSNSTGFQFQITNYDPDLTYLLTVLDACGCKVTKSSTGLVTVQGLIDDGSAGISPRMKTDVGVDVVYPGKSLIPSRGSVTGAVTFTPLFPGFTDMRAIDGQESVQCLRMRELCAGVGVGFKIKNYTEGYTWYFTIPGELPGRADLNYTTGEVTVMPLGAQEKINLEVTASKNGAIVFRQVVPINGMDFSLSLNPKITDYSGSITGFTAQISNYDPAYSWTASATVGKVEISPTGLIKVTSLAPGQETRVTINTSRPGYKSGGVTIGGRAIVMDAVNPTFGPASANENGFTVQITNFDSAFEWKATTSAGTVSISSTGLVTVEGLNNQSAQVTVENSRIGYEPGKSWTSATSLTSKPALVPSLLGAWTKSMSGFTAQISNFDPNYKWTASSTAGSISIGAQGLVTVSGLGPGQSVNFTIQTLRAGYQKGSTTASGSAEILEMPKFGAVSASQTALSIPVVNYDPGALYTVKTTAGKITIAGDGLITVTGLSRSSLITITVIATKNGIQRVAQVAASSSS